VTDFKNAIKRQYHHNWIIDNLPAASILDTDQFVTTQYVGFPVGYQDGNSYYLYNHVNIILEVLLLSTSLACLYCSLLPLSPLPPGPSAPCDHVQYHTVETDGHRIVGFYVEPLSVKHAFSRYVYTPLCH
jgi:transmembrane 9 superfamily protein 2/4